MHLGQMPGVGEASGRAGQGRGRVISATRACYRRWASTVLQCSKTCLYVMFEIDAKQPGGLSIPHN